MPQRKRKLRIGVSDESPFIFHSINTILGKEFSDLNMTIYPLRAEHLLSIQKAEMPDILITDFCFSFECNELNGVKKLEQIHKKHPDLKIIIFTAQKSQAVLKSILQVPINAIVHKRDDIRDLVRAFNWACSPSTEIYYSEEMKNLVFSAPADSAPTLLSPSEIEVIRLFATGYSLMEIAKARKRSISTVATQKYNAMRKLHLQSNTDLIKYVFAQELV